MSIKIDNPLCKSILTNNKGRSANLCRSLKLGERHLHTDAVILTGPKTLGVDRVALADPGASDIVVDIRHSGISTGTEKLFWSGNMPPFPGMGYPLIPGYEAAGEVVEAGPDATFKVGDHVFVPGANCYGEVKGLFGGASARLVSDSARAVQIDPNIGAEGALLALAATAYHALLGPRAELPDLIVPFKRDVYKSMLQEFEPILFPDGHNG